MTSCPQRLAGECLLSGWREYPLSECMQLRRELSLVPHEVTQHEQWAREIEIRVLRYVPKWRGSGNEVCLDQQY